jgi:hypothetical protein
LPPAACVFGCGELFFIQAPEIFVHAVTSCG